ncbi:MAG: tRNA (guanosine(37)-N1)-methyltransferase TrmD [Planctomycetaceae bacterium]|jgi:tRNA (guanine37-N1)-methyltransferase|nr:tRNA (guanosine(37)-N1)-methyltransferase TrmD [Planctomycetaceae bacterium]
MLVDILTLFPGIFTGFISESLLAGAVRNGLLTVRLHNMRDWADDKHNTMDDTPAGGGAGMVLKVDRVVPSVEAVQAIDGDAGKLVMLTPQGRTLNQRIAESLAKERRLVLLCGRYEGFDDRVRQILNPDEISIGDYILNGGETAAMVLIETVMRLIPGVLGDRDSSKFDSFSNGNRLLESPQFTRPREYRGLQIPEVLLNGNHAAIEKWRQEQSQKLTRERRPDLFDRERE